MLSDTSIIRDGRENIFNRIKQYIRKKTSKLFRPKLNKTIQKKLGDTQFTIFSNNCLGGVFYHDAHRQFTTPLVNTALDGEDFILFLEDPKHYLFHDMDFISWPGHDYPIARIDDIEVRFVHYKTNDEAERKWRERAQRIIWSNVFIIATNHDGMNRLDLMERFDKLPYKNKIMFVTEDYPEYKWAIKVPQFNGRFQVKIMTAFANLKGERYYETCFDIAEWINKNTNT